MAKLSHAARDRLPDSAFAVINRTATTEKDRRKYPLDTANRARNALARVHRFGSPRERHLVCLKVHRRYPKIHAASCPLPYMAHPAVMKRLRA